MLTNTAGYFCFYLEQVGLVATCLGLYVNEISSQSAFNVSPMFFCKEEKLCYA